jgi:hypothetical protein
MSVKRYQTKGNAQHIEARKKIHARRSMSPTHRESIEKLRLIIIKRFMEMSVRVIGEKHILLMT